MKKNEAKDVVVSKPLYYGDYLPQNVHQYVVKLKRQFYPWDYPKTSGSFIGVDFVDKDKSKAKKMADDFYNYFATSVFKKYDSDKFANDVERLGLDVLYID